MFSSIQVYIFVLIYNVLNLFSSINHNDFIHENFYIVIFWFVDGEDILLKIEIHIYKMVFAIIKNKRKNFVRKESLKITKSKGN